MVVDFQHHYVPAELAAVSMSMESYVNVSMFTVLPETTQVSPVFRLSLS